MATTTTTTTNNNATLAARAAGLFSKTGALGVVEKAIAQAITAKRVHPAMAEDFGAQLGHELPLKTKDFTRVVGHLLQASDKPLKGVISKRKSEILGILAEIVAVLTDTQPVTLPTWALPKPKAQKAEAEASAEAEAASVGALAKANTLAEAEANAAKAEAAQDKRLADAIALIVSRAAELTEEQRGMLAAVLVSTSAEAEAEAEAEATEAEA